MDLYQSSTIATDEDLQTIQKTIEEAAKKVAHTTKAERQREVKKTSREVTMKRTADQGT